MVYIMFTIVKLLGKHKSVCVLLCAFTLLCFCITKQVKHDPADTDSMLCCRAWEWAPRRSSMLRPAAAVTEWFCVAQAWISISAAFMKRPAPITLSPALHHITSQYFCCCYWVVLCGSGMNQHQCCIHETSSSDHTESGFTSHLISVLLLLLLSGSVWLRHESASVLHSWNVQLRSHRVRPHITSHLSTSAAVTEWFCVAQAWISISAAFMKRPAPITQSPASHHISVLLLLLLSGSVWLRHESASVQHSWNVQLRSHRVRPHISAQYFCCCGKDPWKRENTSVTFYIFTAVCL